MKRNLIALILSFAMALGCCLSASAYSVSEVQITETELGTLYQGSGGTVEYLDNIKGFYLENITKDDFIEALDNAFEETPGFKFKQNTLAKPSKDFINKSNTILTSRGMDISSTKTTNYTRDYTLNCYIDPPFDYEAPIRVYYVVRMNMTTVTYNGTEYAVFVDFSLTSNGSLESGSYEFSDGTSDPVYEISYGGAVMSVQQMIQLQTTTTYDSSVSVGLDWFGVSVGTGSSVHLRNVTRAYSDSVILPVIDIVT